MAQRAGGGQVSVSTIVAITVRLALTYGPTTVPTRRSPLTTHYQPTARMQIFFREEGGTTNRAFGGFSAPAFVNQQNPGIPTNEVFDSRVYFNQTTGGISYRKSARTQFIAEGVGFFIKRTHSLISVQGYEAGGSVIHQLSRSHSIGVRYDFIRFEYPQDLRRIAIFTCCLFSTTGE